MGISGPAARFPRRVLAGWSNAVINSANEVASALGSHQPAASALAWLNFGRA